MKKGSLLGVILVLLLFFISNTANSQVVKTNKYAGLYSFGNSPKKGAVGSATIYPETDSTVLFYIDICRGAPSYNLGQLYSRLKLLNGKGVYYSNDFGDKGCKWEIIFDNNSLIIKTIDDCDECGFGHAVFADNKYARKDNLIHNFFTDGHGRKIYFNKTSPADYLK